MRTGWLAQGSLWYWLESSGAMATGWRFINGTWYWFAADGHWAA
jgi:glucan-binding YG repeat protein